jgi:hypothetical protein
MQFYLKTTLKCYVIPLSNGFKLASDEFSIPPSPRPFNYDILLSTLCICWDLWLNFMTIYHFPIYATCPTHIIPFDLTVLRLCDYE